MNNNLFHIDVRANTLHIPEIRMQAKKLLEESLLNATPDILNRQKELPTFITLEYGTYSGLMGEARSCYEFGFFYAAVSLICIAAEKFAIELSPKKKGDQSKRLILLKDTNIIAPKHYEKLGKISRVRDKYMHPKKIEEADEKKDALEAISLFNEVIQERFFDKYEIRDGIIFEKNTNQAIKIIVP